MLSLRLILAVVFLLATGTHLKAFPMTVEPIQRGYVRDRINMFNNLNSPSSTDKILGKSSDKTFKSNKITREKEKGPYVEPHRFLPKNSHGNTKRINEWDTVKRVMDSLKNDEEKIAFTNDLLTAEKVVVDANGGSQLSHDVSSSTPTEGLQSGHTSSPSGIDSKPFKGKDEKGSFSIIGGIINHDLPQASPGAIQQSTPYPTPYGSYQKKCSATLTSHTINRSKSTEGSSTSKQYVSNLSNSGSKVLMKLDSRLKGFPRNSITLTPDEEVAANLGNGNLELSTGAPIEPKAINQIQNQRKY